MPTRGRGPRIAVAGPLSGPGQRLGRELVQAVELAVEEQGADLAQGGRVELQVADDQGEAGRGEELARSFCEERGVLGVVGHYNSHVTLPAAAIYGAAGLPLLAPIVSNPDLTDHRLGPVFRLTNRDDRTAAALADHARSALGKRRAAVVATRTTYGRSMAGAFSRAFQAAGGEVLAQLEAEEGARELSGTVSGIPAAADLVFYGGTFEGVPLLRALRQAGREQLLATGDGCWDVPNFLEPAGPLAAEGEGVLVLSATPELGRVPGSVEVARRYERRFGPVINYALNAFDAARVLLQAVEEAAAAAHGAPSREEVVAALWRTDFKGVALPGRTRWDERGDNLAAVTALHRVAGGRFAEVAERGVTPPPRPR